MKAIKIISAILLSSLFSFSSFTAEAQDIALGRGSNNISVKVGFGGFSNIKLPPITVSYEGIVSEFGRHWSVGVGASASILSQGYESVSYVGGGIWATGAVHFSPIYQVDIYAGPWLGYLYCVYDNSSAGAFDISGFIGARYFFTELFGVELQIGGNSIVNAGVSFRF